MHMDAASRIARQPSRHSFEHPPRESEREKHPHIPIAMDFYQSPDLFEFAAAAAAAIDIEDIVQSAERGGEEHHTDRYPGETAIPVEEVGDNSDRNNHQQSAHYRHAALAAPGAQGERGVIFGLAGEIVLV